jgi:hypothetical protein
MEEFRQQFLPDGWERKLRLSILGSKQGQRRFNDWLIEMQGANTIMIGRPGHVNDDALRDHMEANMSSPLALKCEANNTNATTDFCTWTIAVDKLDKGLMQERAAAVAAAEDVFRANRGSKVLDSRSRSTPTGSAPTGAR